MRRILTASLATFVLISACGGDDGRVTEVTSDTVAPDSTNAASETTTGDPDTGDGASGTVEYSTEIFATPEYDWTDCGAGLECAYIDVPLDYSDTNSDTISIYMTRHLALDPSERIGTLLVNPGGPGFGEWLQLWRETFDSFEEFAGPVVACVDGPALAGGLEMSLACDLIVASEKAKLGDVHARYGLVPGGGGSQRLVDAVGVRLARWLMYTGELVSAQRALEMGLVQQVFAAESFEADVVAFLTRMAERSAPSTHFMKAMSRSSHVTAAGLDRELEEAARVVAGPDAMEGLAAFVERREPKFA